MPRTSQVNPLDSLNLDDMFSNDDDLFGDLGLDLNIDDIAGDSSQGNVTPAPSLNTETAADSTAASGRRRKAKRKTKSPAFFDYDDYEDDDFSEEPVKKKKKTSTKRKGSAKVLTKARTETASSMDLSTAGSGFVAAAGRYGHQAKKASSPAKKKLSAKSVETDSAYGTSKSVPRTHPGIPQSSYCGIMPSATLFYPFMPTLPPEPSLKNRKKYGHVDKINTQLTTVLSEENTAANNGDGTTVDDAEPIYRIISTLLQEDKADHGPDIVKRAISSIRTMIEDTDGQVLIGDLLAVAALIKRQHDFLMQNTANMQRWCMEHFSKDDYAAVYLAPAEPDVAVALASLHTREIRVKIKCLGISQSSTIPATLPITFPIAEDKKKAKKAKKKKSPLDPDSILLDTPTMEDDKEVSYARMRPGRRCQEVTNLVSKVARELESKYLKRVTDRGMSIEKSQADINRFLEDEKGHLLNTAGMWKWLEQAGYFSPITEEEVKWRFDGVFSPEELEKSEASNSKLSNPSTESSMLDRLHSLLVEEGPEFIEDHDSEIAVRNRNGLTDDGSKENDVIVVEAGMSADDILEKQLSSLGLDLCGPTVRIGMNVKVSIQGHSAVEGVTETEAVAIEQEEDLDLVMKSMIEDLQQVNRLNNKRTAHLKVISRAHTTRADALKREKDEESALVARCHHILKKARDQKAKNGKKSSTDGIALPW